MKKLISFCLCLLIVLSVAGAFAATTDQRVFDQAGILSTAERAQAQAAIESFTKKTGMDFVLLTSDTEHEDASAQAVSDGFYDKYQFGADDGERSGALYYIDMYERYPYLSTTGKMIDYINDSRLSELHEITNTYLRSGDYYRCVTALLTLLEQYYEQGIPDDAYRYDIFTGQRLTSRQNALTSGELIIALVIGLIVMLCVMAGVKRSYLLKGSTYHYDYQGNSEVKITKATDQFLRTTTTRTRKADSNSGGGSGGGHGSGVHSSGGTTHGGGGGSHF